MEQTPSFVFNNSVTGGSNQINQGQNVTATQTVNNASGSMDLPAFFDQLAKLLTPAEQAVAEQIGVPNSIYSHELLADAGDAQNNAQAGCEAALEAALHVEQNAEASADPTAATAEPAPEQQSMVQRLQTKIKLYGPIVGKSLLAFGSAALQATIATNPVVAGLIAAIQQVQKEVDE
jgi:hypothetical protein